MNVVRHSLRVDEVATSLLAHARRLWKSVWDSREYVRAWPCSERGEGFKGTSKYAEPLTTVLVWYHTLYWQLFVVDSLLRANID